MRANAGTGGRAEQLEILGQTLERPSWTLCPMTTVPQDEPVNPMAPTPAQKKRGGGNSLSELSEEPEEQDDEIEHEDDWLNFDLYDALPDADLYEDHPMDDSHEKSDNSDCDFQQGLMDDGHQLDLNNGDTNGNFTPSDDNDNEHQRRFAAHVDQVNCRFLSHTNEHQRCFTAHVERPDHSASRVEPQDNSVAHVERQDRPAPHVEQQDHSTAHNKNIQPLHITKRRPLAPLVIPLPNAILLPNSPPATQLLTKHKGKHYPHHSSLLKIHKTQWIVRMQFRTVQDMNSTMQPTTVLTPLPRDISMMYAVMNEQEREVDQASSAAGKEGEGRKEKDKEPDGDRGQGKKSATCSKDKEKDASPKDTVLSFYPRHWCEVAVDGWCLEVLNEVIAYYKTQSWKLEKGFYPEHRTGMCKLIFNNMQTFRSDLKKKVVRNLHVEYNILPSKNPKNAEECIAQIKSKAAELLSSASYLHRDPDANGKTSNFAHCGLQWPCLAFFYSSSKKALHQFAKFQPHMPYKALTLVGAIVHGLLGGLRDYGDDHLTFENTNWSDICTAQEWLNLSLTQLLEHKYHGPKLNTMLEDWAQTGMLGFKTQIPESKQDEFVMLLWSLVVAVVIAGVVYGLWVIAVVAGLSLWSLWSLDCRHVAVVAVVAVPTIFLIMGLNCMSLTVSWTVGGVHAYGPWQLASNSQRLYRHCTGTCVLYSTAPVLYKTGHCWPAMKGFADVVEPVKEVLVFAASIKK
ncbi:hypothetical protein L210DRAFT_3510131 [Boletus edulis BED1]|uniref:DUF6532 domain-containing protein n=1 Tax=Boletus edulis BED1 TaxID=1328754 RepID=A0AAD4BD43_BOLED|nr:hypothetical protein L210DRAFT_3510131 [Boletus edulis BED1]